MARWGCRKKKNIIRHSGGKKQETSNQDGVRKNGGTSLGTVAGGTADQQEEWCQEGLGNSIRNRGRKNRRTARRTVLGRIGDSIRKGGRKKRRTARGTVCQEE